LWFFIQTGAYLPTEDIPDFTSTTYTYLGVDGDEAPEDVTEVVFHSSVTTIKGWAFRDCMCLGRVTIPDTVTWIEGSAFMGCHSLRFTIRFARTLEFIGDYAFAFCESLEAVFLSPTVTHIDDSAFMRCISLRFCILPEPIDYIGNGVFRGCNRLLSTTVRNTLSKACSSTSVNTQTIQECIHAYRIERALEVNDQHMKKAAFHILCANPHVTGEAIRVYLQLAPEAAEQEDSEGTTPFQYLCRNDITILEYRHFSSFDGIVVRLYASPDRNEQEANRE